MVLYVGASLYHILCFAIHKLIFHPDEKAVIVTGDNIYSKSGMDELKQRVEASQIFSQFVILKFIDRAYTNPIHLNELSVTKDVDAYIKYNEQWVEEWLKKKKMDLEVFDEINLAIDHRHLGLYILSKQMPYQYFEDGNGLLSRGDIQREFHKKAQYASYAVSQRLHALGESFVVTKKYANMDAQINGFQDEKVEHFSVATYFPRLKEEERKAIFTMFSCEEPIETAKNPILYLTRYVQYFQKPTMRNHHYITTLVLDLFAENRPIIIKPHPRDFSGRYEEICEDAKVLPKEFPSELLPHMMEGMYEKIITIGSTAIDALAENTKEVIKLDVNFEEKLDSIFSYIAAVNVIQEIYPNLNENQGKARGCLMEFLKPLWKETFGFSIHDSMEYSKIAIVDENRGIIPEAETICFLNTDHRFQFNDLGFIQWNDVIPISVQVVADENSYGENQYMQMYFYTTRTEIKEKLKKLSLMKRFRRTKLTLFINCNETKETYQTKLARFTSIICQYNRKQGRNDVWDDRKIERIITEKDNKMMESLVCQIEERR